MTLDNDSSVEPYLVWQLLRVEQWTALYVCVCTQELYRVCSNTMGGYECLSTLPYIYSTVWILNSTLGMCMYAYLCCYIWHGICFTWREVISMVCAVYVHHVLVQYSLQWKMMQMTLRLGRLSSVYIAAMLELFIEQWCFFQHCKCLPVFSEYGTQQLGYTLTHTHSLSLTHTHTHSLTLTHTHTHIHTHIHIFTRTYTLTLTLTHSHTHTLTHTHTHTHTGMDLYASSLWHLQREVELSVVAESLYSSNKLRPESLCAMATVMNLSRNHEGAIKFLTRAIQV